jgi:hypothetical protein
MKSFLLIVSIFWLSLAGQIHAQNLPPEVLRYADMVFFNGKIVTADERCCRPADEAEAFYLLRDNGHRNVAVLQEGFSRWTSLNYPLEAGTR